jgi:hypothetical protein
MRSFPDKLFVYEINTWVWLSELSKKHERKVTLDNLPDEAIDTIAMPGLDVIWLMGVWKRSPFGRENALKYKHEYQPALPDMTDDDVIGSAYAISDYEVDERIGGRSGLASFRERLKQRGLRLLLDYVPNHVACDHPWVHDHPAFIVMGNPEDVKKRPSDFFATKDKDGKDVVLAHGRDPLFPGWSDTAQLNAFNPELRKAVVEVLLDIASQCDGVRCDMAMLLFNDIFAGTWNGYIGPKPEKDYWEEIIPQVREKHSEFLFVAEVYWDKEHEILQQGFDFAYDKVLYDRIMENDVQKLRQHLVASIEFQQQMMRFIENHDEPRAYDKLGHDRSFPAATLICTLPGGCLLHDGQLTGRIVKLPVQIARAPQEEEHKDLEEYYLKLLKETRDPIYQHGDFYLFEVSPSSPDNISHFNMLAYGWREPEKDYRLMVVNLTEYRSQGRVSLHPWDWIAGKTCRLFNVLDGAEYTRHGGEMTNEGLFIDLDPYESHVFRFELVSMTESEPAPQEQV